MVQPETIQSCVPWALLLFGVLVLAIQRARRRNPPQPTVQALATSEKPSEDAYRSIEALRSLDLANEQPIQLRPFKPKWHLTMALENTTMSDLIAMDNTYESRIKLRSDLIREKKSDVLAYRPAVGPSVLEFYSWMTNTYLPQRFPTVYSTNAQGLQNNVTGLTLPQNLTNTDEALSLLGSNVDCDFLFLLPIPSNEIPGEEGVKYRLEGFITCFPSGFNTRSKLGLSLADIHLPVPGYAAKLKKSMDRFFATLPVGRIVKRHNWTITTNPDLHALSGTHIHSEDDLADIIQDEVDLSQAVLRCERQTLHRLPGTKALVFAFKTYTYPLAEVKEKEDLAAAIEGLGKGNVPEMTIYKRQVVWGEKAVAYLRGKIGK